jgi:hypothetical protein
MFDPLGPFLKARVTFMDEQQLVKSGDGVFFLLLFRLSNVTIVG